MIRKLFTAFSEAINGVEFRCETLGRGFVYPQGETHLKMAKNGLCGCPFLSLPVIELASPIAHMRRQLVERVFAGCDALELVSPGLRFSAGQDALKTLTSEH